MKHILFVEQKNVSQSNEGVAEYVRPPNMLGRLCYFIRSHLLLMLLLLERACRSYNGTAVAYLKCFELRIHDKSTNWHNKKILLWRFFPKDEADTLHPSDILTTNE